MARRPSVLIVDDRPDDDARTYEHKLQARNISASAQFPSDVQSRDLYDADVILVDFDLEAWTATGSTALEISRQPKDGLALAAVLRRYAHTVDRRRSPMAVALITQKIAAAMSPLPPTNRAHIAASLNGLEWIFDKKDDALLEKIESLAVATQAIPRDWGGSDLPKLRKLLELDSQGDKRLADDMLEDALRCIPPVHEIRDWEQGIALVRWLLHRVLPYPCFLIDVSYLAARFAIDPEVLSAALKTSKSLRRVLEPYLYKGVLAGFSGERWWRVGVEAFLWKETDKNSFDPNAVTGAVNKHLRAKLQPTAAENGVVSLDEDFQAFGKLVPKADAVRIWPDDWPSYALQPWTSLAMAQGSRLSALVVETDRPRL